MAEFLFSEVERNAFEQRFTTLCRDRGYREKMSQRRAGGKLASLWREAAMTVVTVRRLPEAVRDGQIDRRSRCIALRRRSGRLHRYGGRAMLGGRPLLC